MILYFDTSALVKRYTTETGSNWVRNQCSPAQQNRVVTSLIARAEAGAAFASKVRQGLLTTSDYQSIVSQVSHDFIFEYLQLPIDSALVDSAVALSDRNALRGYDSIHLAAAVTMNNYLTQHSLAPLTFICADIDLLAAAQAEGLTTDDPNQHP